MLKNKTVLIVDDIFVMRQSIKRYLTEFGCKVVGECDNGYDAIEAYDRLKPDFVTLDITMPQKNSITCGVDTLEALKKMDNDVKTIMITSHGEQKQILKALSKGACGYLLKPIKKDKLLAAVNRVFSKVNKV